MNQKYAMGIVILIIISAIFVSGCAQPQNNSSNSNSSQNENNVSALNNNPGTENNPANSSEPAINDSEMKQIYEDSKVPAVPKTSLENLDSAYVEQKISKEDYILLSLQAIFDPVNLPAGYSGGQLVGYDATDEIMLAKENWDSLSQETKEKINDWVFMPENEVRAEKKISASTQGEKSNTIYFADDDTKLYTLDAIPGKAVVRTFAPPNLSAADKADLDKKMAWVKQGIVDSWSKFKELLGLEPTKEVYFYIGKISPGTVGEAEISDEPSFDPVERCRLKVDVTQTLDETTTKSFVAHELFHCFQYYLPLRNLGNAEQRWLKEATATWSMDYIYPEANKEHQYLPLFFKTRNVALVMRQGNKEYADYVFFLFLQENGSEKDVANVLLSAKNKSVKDVLQALTDYENKFADFSEWNWNKEPVKNYRDDPAFPDLSIQGPALKFEQLLFADEETNEVALDAGSAEYRTFDVSGSLDLKKVQFKFHDTGDSKHQRHALVKINGQWKEENWTDLEEKRFCLDKPEEKVQAIVLIYSNSDLKAPYFTEYDVDTKGECPKEITGTTTVTLDASLGDSKITGKVTSNDVLQYDETTDEYKLKSRTINCTYESTGVISAISWGQPVVISGTTTGTGSLTENYDDLATAPVKIAFDRPGKIAYLTIEPEKKNQKWVHYTMNEEMIAGQLNGKSNWTEDGDCSANMVFSDLELNTDQYLKDNVLHYERTITDTEGIVTTTLKADYSLTPK